MSLAHRLRFISGHKGRTAVLPLISSTEPHLSFAVAIILSRALFFIHPCDDFILPRCYGGNGSPASPVSNRIKVPAGRPDRHFDCFSVGFPLEAERAAEYFLALALSPPLFYGCRIMVQRILMPPVVGVLLHLLRMVAVYRIFRQIFGNVLQIFVSGRLFGHVCTRLIRSSKVLALVRIHGDAVHSLQPSFE